MLVGPSLCVAGFVTHECDRELPGGCEHESDGHDDTGCGHESDCPDDPCSAVAVSFARRSNGGDAERHVCLAYVVVQVLTIDRLQPAAAPMFHERPLEAGLPRPISDIPLLI